jgi:hypothetical protein
MDAPAGAYGAFTFERQDEEAGVGKGSEYGGGLLRFWQGRFFGFVQAERETPASWAAVLALGKAVASGLGSRGEEPALVRALPDGDQRPRSLRFVRSPLLLQIVEPRAQGNPFGLPVQCEAVTARYGPKGAQERVLLALTPQFYGRGPHSFDPRYVWNYGGMFVSRDPVAVDALGAELLRLKRLEFFGEDRPVTPTIHIQMADTRHGVGVADLKRIDLVKIGWQEKTFPA